MLLTVKVMGSPAKVLENFDGDTVSDVLAFLELTGNYTVNIGGQPATKESNLSDGQYIVLAPSVKGAAAKKTKKRAVSANPNKAPLKTSKKAIKKVETKRK